MVGVEGVVMRAISPGAGECGYGTARYAPCRVEVRYVEKRSMLSAVGRRAD